MFGISLLIKLFEGEWSDWEDIGICSGSCGGGEGEVRGGRVAGQVVITCPGTPEKGE